MKRKHPKRTVALANSSTAADVLALDNELALDNDGWALLAPFGEFPNSRTVEVAGRPVHERFLQVFDEAGVDTVLANERGDGLWARIKRAVIKRPIFKGHPDAKLWTPNLLDRAQEKLVAVGLVDSSRKTERGLEVRPQLVPDGAAAVEQDGCKYMSGLFEFERTGVIRPDGSIEVRPLRILSVGLTAHPNISGVDSLANARANKPAASEEKTKTDPDTMKQLLIGWLAERGVTPPADATDQAVFDALLKQAGAAGESLPALDNERKTLAASVASLTVARDAEKRRADEATLTLDNERAALKAERQARCEAVVDIHIGAGRIAVADRAAKVAALLALANDALAAEITALEKLPAKFATSSSLAGRKAAANPTTAALALSNEIAALVREGKTRGAALDEIIRTKPEIYEAYRNEGCSVSL